METAKCPDCNAIISSRHALASGNAYAGEMDNSRFAINSDAANLQNFDPVVKMYLVVKLFYYFSSNIPNSIHQHTFFLNYTTRCFIHHMFVLNIYIVELE